MPIFSFRLLLTAFFVLALGSAANADVPPSGGSCQISPVVGTAATTPFELSCSNWTDADQETPLQYRFAYLDGGTPTPLSGFSEQPLLETTLPQGAGPQAELPIVAIIRDTSGATTAVTITATVAGGGHDPVAAFAPSLADAIQSELDRGDPDRILQLAASVGEDKEEAERADDLLREELAKRAARLKRLAKGLKIARKLVKKVRTNGVEVGDQCSFWDTTEEKWSTKDCAYQNVETHTICTCSHL